MKHLPFACLALLSSACSSSPTVAPLTPSQQKVQAYLKKTLDDPASYQPAYWGKEETMTRRDSVSIAVISMVKSSDRNVRDRAYGLMDRYGKDSTTIVGTTLTHSFRAKNKLGGLVLDSARFVIGSAGAVAVLP